MNKSILAIAVAATMAAPAVMAAPTVYGNLHVAISDLDSEDNLRMGSNTSALGVKGSEDLGDGLKAIYKIEFQLDAASGSASGDALTNRDTWVGLKGGLGTIKFGLMSSNYKQKGGKVDSLYRTPIEGRGFLHTQSNLHNGRAINRGRSTNTVQYTSNKFSGIQLVLNTTVSGSDEETNGLGIRWANKNIMVFADWIDTQPGTAVAVGGTTESAVKVGGKFSSKAFHVGGQFESAEDVTGFDYLHVNAGFNIDKNNSIQVTVGTATHIVSDAADTESFAVAYNHKLSKMTNVYLGYADRSSDLVTSEDTIFTAGIKKKF